MAVLDDQRGYIAQHGDVFDNFERGQTITLEQYRKVDADLERPLTWGPIQHHATEAQRHLSAQPHEHTPVGGLVGVKSHS